MKKIVNLLFGGIVLFCATYAFADLKITSDKSIAIVANKLSIIPLRFSSSNVHVEIDEDYIDQKTQDFLKMPDGLILATDKDGNYSLIGGIKFNPKISSYSIALNITDGVETIQEIITINVVPIKFRLKVVSPILESLLVSEGDDVNIQIVDVETMSEPTDSDFEISYVRPSWMWYNNWSFHGVVLIQDRNSISEQYNLKVRISYKDKETGETYTSEEQNVSLFRSRLTESYSRIFKGYRYSNSNCDLKITSSKELICPSGTEFSFKLQASDPNATFDLGSELPPGVRLELDNDGYYYLRGKIDFSDYVCFGVVLRISNSDNCTKEEIVTFCKEDVSKKLNTNLKSNNVSTTVGVSSGSSGGGGGGAGVAAGILGAAALGGLLWWACS